MQNFSSIGKRIHARKKIGHFFDTPCIFLNLQIQCTAEGITQFERIHEAFFASLPFFAVCDC